MTERKARCDDIGGTEERDLVLPQVPNRRDKRQHKPAAEDAACLQGAEAEDFPRIGRVVAPIRNDVQRLRADDQESL